MLTEKIKIEIILFYLNLRLNVTFGNEDDNWIAGGGEVFDNKFVLSIRLYGFILQSVWTPWTSNLCF